MMDDTNSEGTGNDARNTIIIKLNGSDSYWFGDEKTWMNSEKSDFNSGDIFDITLENGAQWTYFGLDYSRKTGNQEYDTIRKRVSSITLNGGIINLYDKDIEKTWKEIGLWDKLESGHYGIDPKREHDYVRIGELKGNGGIFRLDLNAFDKNKSDIVFIEKGEGQHLFEPYNLVLLESITPENSLTFALTGKDFDGKFSDKINLEGETLYQYELEVNSRPITQEDISNPDNSYWDVTSNLENNDASKFNLDDYVDGTNWFIQRIKMSESSAARAMTSAGYAAYDAALEMDRKDRREAQINYSEANTGFWVRIASGSTGIDQQYQWDHSGVSIGFERTLTFNNKIGTWFRYDKGDTNLLDVNGSGQMERYEFALYDLLNFNNHYLDFVARLGRVSSDFNVSSRYQTVGSFNQDYLALSAEYGHHFALPFNLYVEPQAQIQVSLLKDYEYNSSRGMSVKADSDTSILSRLGLRIGKEFFSEEIQGQIFARADVYHQFTNGQSATYQDRDNHSMNASWGDKNTFCMIGLGAAVNWARNYALQFNIEHATGGDLNDTWQVSGQFRYNF